MSRIEEFKNFNKVSESITEDKNAIQFILISRPTLTDYNNILDVVRGYNNEKLPYYKDGFEFIKLDIKSYLSFKENLKRVSKISKHPDKEYIYYIKPELADKLNDLGLATEELIKQEKERFRLQSLKSILIGKTPSELDKI